MQRPAKGIQSEESASVKALGQGLTLHNGEKSEQGARREEMGSDPDGADPGECGFLCLPPCFMFMNTDYSLLHHFCLFSYFLSASCIDMNSVKAGTLPCPPLCLAVPRVWHSVHGH